MPNAPRNTQMQVLWFLSGLTCTHENAMLKAGMQKFAQLHKIAVVFPDTSPRGKNIPDDDSYDLGQGPVSILMLLNRRERKLSDVGLSYFRVTQCDRKNFNVDISRQSVMGHSMGGHGALLLAFQMNIKFRSVSAFAPICNPMSQIGVQAISAYLGSDKNLWENYDASVVAQQTNFLALF